MRSILSSVALFLGCAGTLLAFDVQATLKKIDVDKVVIYFHANQKDRSAKVEAGAKILGADGKPLTDGLKSKELREGVIATLTIEAVDGKPIVKAIRLSNQTAKVEPAEVKQMDTSGLIPLTEMKAKKYQGFAGGLYPDGGNLRPTAHEAAGLALAKEIQPLDGDGKPTKTGKIVLLGIGFSNTVQAFNGFIQVAKDDKEISPAVVLVNGAVGGMSAEMVQQTKEGRGAKYWSLVDDALKKAGVTRAQVQVIWMKETNPQPHVGGFPKYIQELEAQLGHIVRIERERFPNLKMTYLSSRTFGGWARPKEGNKAPGNGEPYSYETGFAVKWLVEKQIKGDAELNFDPKKGNVKAPWLSWGPYLWANGQTKRSDGFHFEPADYREDDRMHHSAQGMTKMGRELVRFFKSDTTTKTWFSR
jgi:hypothetical protein